MITRSFLPAAALRMVMLLLLAAFVGSAWAECRPDITSVTYVQTVPVRFVEAPDVLLHTANTRVIVYQCESSEQGWLRPAFAGLTYVRHIEGAPAYELAPDSPLMTISFDSRYEPDDGPIGEGITVPLNAFNDEPWPVLPGRTLVYASLRFYSRGGPMWPLPQRYLGSVHVVSSGPSEFSFEVGYEFQGQTCALTDTDVQLDPVQAHVLDQQGVAAQKEFAVMMNCGVAGRPVSLKISDAVDPGNMTDVLAPTADSQARGVGLQMLYQGQPLPMGRVWQYSDSTGAQEAIPFQARYLRTAGEVQPGVIRGEAVLLADYY